MVGWPNALATSQRSGDLCDTAGHDALGRCVAVLSGFVKPSIRLSTPLLWSFLMTSFPITYPAPVRPVSRLPMVSAPTRLRLPDLLHATDRAADDVLSGRCDHLLPEDGLPTTQRWFTRIQGDDEIDIWLISWVPGQPTELHDHGGSLGALTVLSGTLREFRWDTHQWQSRRLNAGDQAGFPLGWVHDVVWAPTLGESARAATSTLSVHAYSPPLTVMSYYEVTEENRLRRRRTALTDQPEAS